MFDKETIGSNNSLGQVNIELKYLDLDEPIRKQYPLADLVSSLFQSHLDLVIALVMLLKNYFLDTCNILTCI